MVNIVFCEGKPNSLDARVLQRLDIPSRTWPAGGKRGINAFVDGALSGQGSPAPTYLIFRDRDLDAQPPAAPVLIQLPGTSKRTFTTYRACIESYLISPDLLHEFWNLPPQTTAFGPAPGVSELAARIEAAARQISGYEAVRWALSGLLDQVKFPHLEDRLTDQSGILPPNTAFADCRTEAEARIRKFKSAVAAFDVQLFRRIAKEHHRKFQDPRFYSQSQYLVWFHGKDLCAAVRNNLGFSVDKMRAFLTWAVEKFDPLAFPDFTELKKICS